METVEVEQPVLNTSVDVLKPNIIEGVSADESGVCHKSNGVDSDVQADVEHSEADNVPSEVPNVPSEVASEVGSMPPEVGTVSPEVENVLPDANTVPEPDDNVAKSDKESKPSHVESIIENDSIEPEIVPDAELEISNTDDEHGKAIDELDSNIDHEITIEEVPNNVITETVIQTEKEICIEEVITTETVVEMDSSIQTVQFETEVLVEENDYDVTEKMLEDSQESDQSNDILNELGPNIELSEVLRSSDISGNVENNNSSVKQEIYNKEELLDILEGNDSVEKSNKITESSSPVHKVLVAEIAMQQLSRLKAKKRKEKSKSPLKMSNNKNSEKRKQKQNREGESNQDAKVIGHSEDQLDNTAPQSQHNEIEQDSSIGDSQSHLQAKLEKHTDNIVKTLVMDWDDDPNDNNDNTIIKEADNLLQDSEQLKNIQKSIISKDDSIDTTDSQSAEAEVKIKTEDDAPTRRISRVIKKKVIFDPDNPDTFTKGKSSKTKETHTIKEHTPSKKVKPDQTILRSKSKSPLSKMQWKKPMGASNKNSKQHKRLSEVDRLLMDEGAVNMIYQLTPEAPKGKKNVKTKAEFIKKIQSSRTPDTKEMKFRERKKESKYEEGEAKKILGGKHRSSLSSSVKFPCVSEDFENHSADDSIIYRRHSSSSYSSSCMSPRRLSDVESGNIQTQSSNRISAKPIQDEADLKLVNEETVFQSDMSKISSNEMINKDDCLSIKEKLNSKLSKVLNKRKRDNSKPEKPAKVKKAVKPDEGVNLITDEDNKLNQFKFISVTFDERLALICIKKTGLKICVEILKELEEALKYIDSRQDISVTLLESQCGTLCSSLDLSLLLDENQEIRVSHAYEIAESVRCVLAAAASHRALLCCGVWGAVAGVALALVALSDVALASESTAFYFAAGAAPVLPGAAALTARSRPLPQALVNDLIVFGRRLSAAEALAGGLVSRVLWAARFDEQARSIAKDIAAQPIQSILLKKRLLNLKSTSDSELTFLASLESERDLLVQYWTSVEGQEMLRATLDAA